MYERIMHIYVQIIMIMRLIQEFSPLGLHTQGIKYWLTISIKILTWAATINVS
jgi:hypothetical protein